MPAKSEKQRKLFAIAKAIKSGKTSKSYSPQAAKIAKELPADEIDKFTKKENVDEMSLDGIFDELVREYRSE